MSDKLLTAEDVAEMLGMRIDFVYALARAATRSLTCRLRRSVRFRDEAITRWLEYSERGNGNR